MSDSAVPDIDHSESPTDQHIHDMSDLLQIINEEKQFSPKLLDYMKTAWNIAGRGFDYHVLAVFGSQSTGKSTLLNKLFNTRFDMMVETQRRQTTKGIWLSRAAETNILVMDVEGTDGRERGDDQDFERKSALFSIATSEVLIINMWETQVGLYNGANMGLLKTVFEVNLELFQRAGSPKTLLLFILRDFTGLTPLENLSATLFADLNKMWGNLNKPVGTESSKIGDFFDFKYVGLPHKHFAAQVFDSKVSELRNWFVDPKSPDYLFEPKYHKHIPADGFPRFAESIWEKIESNRDLDLPTQQQLLAQYRCDEISRTEFTAFVQKIKPLKSVLESGKVIETLGKDISEISETALKNFDHDASRYHADVYKSKRLELREMIYSALHVYYIQQLRNLHKYGILLFQRTIQHAKEDGFAKILNKSKEDSIEYFKKGAEAAKLVGADWTSDEYLSEFQEEIETLASKKKIEVMERVTKSLEQSVADELGELVEQLVNEASPEMWNKIMDEFTQKLNSGVATLCEKFQAFGATAEEIDNALYSYRKQSWDLLYRELKDEFGDDRVLLRLRNRFSESFRYDAHGLPRVWSPGDDIDGIFVKAKDEASKLFDHFAKIDIPIASLMDLLNPENYSIPSSIDPLAAQKSINNEPIVTASQLVMITPARLSVLKERFKKECDVQFLEAKRAIVTVTSRIPPIMYFALLILGWNEFYYFLTNPQFFIFSLFLVLVILGLYFTGLLKPVLTMSKMVFNSLWAQVLQKVHEGEDMILHRHTPTRSNQEFMMEDVGSREEKEFRRRAK